MARTDAVRLRHTTRSGDWAMYFYEGELPVVDSTLTIPADRPEWIQRAWIQGFRLTADGRPVADLAEHIRNETADGTTEELPRVAATPVNETENAESDEENTDEGPLGRGLAPDDDGIRSGEPDRDGSLPEGGDDGRGGDEPADRGEGDEPAD